MSKLLENKNIVIMGVRNKWSIAWGIAEAASKNGANLIFTYQGEREKESVEKLANKLERVECLECDVTYDVNIKTLFQTIGNKYGEVHGVVHAIAHARTDDLHNGFINTSQDGFAHALNISAYSFVATAKYAKDYMKPGGSLITLSYHGAERVCPGYNVMGVAKAALEASVMYLAADLGAYGIRCNSISAGPVNTVSAKGIKDFGNLLQISEQKSPLKRNVTLEELGGAALFLLSELSNGMTGEIMYVDAGQNIMAV